MMIYLASQSARRKQIMSFLDIPFRIIRSDYEEKNKKGTMPGTLTVSHALGKARHARFPQRARLIMGCDTLVWCRGRLLGKPRSRPEALRMLRMISGRKHSVYSGLVIWDRKTNRILKGYSKTDVFVKNLTDEWIERYILKVHPYDKAGGYAIQEKPYLVRKIRGSYTNVVGLPVELMIQFLKRIIRIE